MIRVAKARVTRPDGTAQWGVLYQRGEEDRWRFPKDRARDSYDDAAKIAGDMFGLSYGICLAPSEDVIDTEDFGREDY